MSSLVPFWLLDRSTGRSKHCRFKKDHPVLYVTGSLFLSGTFNVIEHNDSFLLMYNFTEIEKFNFLQCITFRKYFIIFFLYLNNLPFKNKCLQIVFKIPIYSDFMKFKNIYDFMGI